MIGITEENEAAGAQGRANNAERVTAQNPVHQTIAATMHCKQWCFSNHIRPAGADVLIAGQTCGQLTNVQFGTVHRKRIQRITPVYGITDAHEIDHVAFSEPFVKPVLAVSGYSCEPCRRIEDKIQRQPGQFCLTDVHIDLIVARAHQNFSKFNAVIADPWGNAAGYVTGLIFNIDTNGAHTQPCD